MNSIKANAIFAQKYQFPFPLLSDTTGQVCGAYGTCSAPPTGRIKRNTYIVGPGGTIRHVFEDVRPEGHVETVLAFLESSASPARQDVAATSYRTPHNNLDGGPESSQKGAQEKMDDQYQDENGGQTLEAMTQNPRGVTQEAPPAIDAEAITPPAPARQAAEAGLVVAAANGTLAPAHVPGVVPNRVQPAQNNGGPQLVFALGTLGYDFGTEARRDSIMQHMVSPDNPSPNPDDPVQLLAYLEANPDQAASIIWTLNLDATTIYAITAQGAFASMGYDFLRQFLQEQLSEGVERVSIAGVIVGQVALLSGQVVPIIWPELRCMYSWSTAALLEAVCGEPPPDSAKAEVQKAYAQKVEDVTNFLERVYYELRNLGTRPEERAINYAATNALIVENIFEAALKAEMELDTIEVERSPICRPDSECWDVKLTFFNPLKVFEQARKVHRFTVDVSDVCPVMVGKVRSWFVR